MKVKRVIRRQFDCDEKTSFPEEQKKHIEEKQLTQEQDDSNISHFHMSNDTSLDVEKSVDYELDNEVSGLTSQQNLVNCITSVQKRPYGSKLIAVLGINSENVVNDACSIVRRSNEWMYIGTVKCDLQHDVYTDIATYVYNYINSWREHGYCNFNEIYEVQNALKTLSKGVIEPANVNEKDKYSLLYIFYWIKRFINHDRILPPIHTIIVSIELSKIDDNILKMLSELRAEDVIIVVYLLNNANGMSRQIDCLNKFLDRSNILITD